MSFTQLYCNIEGFFPSVLKVPGGMVIHTHNMTDSNNGIISSESMVFVPCTQLEFDAFLDANGTSEVAADEQA